MHVKYETGLVFVFLIELCWFSTAHRSDGNNGTFCPDKPENGEWVRDYIKQRCILSCQADYVPSGCHVIRKRDNQWPPDLPTCKKERLINAKTMAKFGVAIAGAAGTVVVAPAVLAGAGFTSAGVAAGSIAASMQGPAVAAGSWFAVLQSAGAAGISTSSYTLLGSVGGGISALIGQGVDMAYNHFHECEAE